MGKKNVRAIVSVWLFFLFIILLITAIGIEYFDHFHNGGQQLSENLRSRPLHISTRIHALAGYLFCIFSIIHIIINWKALKSYFIKNQHK